MSYDNKTIAIYLGPFLGLFLGVVSFINGFDLLASVTIWVTVWTATWWVFEAVPIPIASLVPLAVLPLFGVLTSKQVAQA